MKRLWQHWRKGMRKGEERDKNEKEGTAEEKRLKVGGLPFMMIVSCKS